MTKKQADRENAKVTKIYEDLKKTMTLEEIAESFIFPVYRSKKEEKQWLAEIHKWRLEHPQTEERKKKNEALSKKYREEEK